MNKILSIFILFCTIITFGQSKKGYLKNNRIDLTTEEFEFPQKDFHIIGFGSYHGNAKTYDAAFFLIKNLKKQGLIDYYIPETNFSQAFFFQQYLKNGDEKLLKKLVLAFQTIVSQEGTIETFEHWKNLKSINQSYAHNPIKVIGCNKIAEYKFPIKHILLLTRNIQNWELKLALKGKLEDKKTDFSINNKEIAALLKEFINDYEVNKSMLLSSNYEYN